MNRETTAPITLGQALAGHPFWDIFFRKEVHFSRGKSLLSNFPLSPLYKDIPFPIPPLEKHLELCVVEYTPHPTTTTTLTAIKILTQSQTAMLKAGLLLMEMFTFIHRKIME